MIFYAYKIKIPDFAVLDVKDDLNDIVFRDSSIFDGGFNFPITLDNITHFIAYSYDDLRTCKVPYFNYSNGLIIPSLNLDYYIIPQDCFDVSLVPFSLWIQEFYFMDSSKLKVFSDGSLYLTFLNKPSYRIYYLLGDYYIFNTNFIVYDVNSDKFYFAFDVLINNKSYIVYIDVENVFIGLYSGCNNSLQYDFYDTKSGLSYGFYSSISSDISFFFFNLTDVVYPYYVFDFNNNPYSFLFSSVNDFGNNDYYLKLSSDFIGGNNYCRSYAFFRPYLLFDYFYNYSFFNSCSPCCSVGVDELRKIRGLLGG